MPRNLVGLDRTELEELAEECGEAPYRGRQLYRGIYRQLLTGFEAFTDLSRRFRDRLAAAYEIRDPGVVRRVASRDESVRYLLGLEGDESVEAVYMPWRVERRRGRAVATPSGRELRAPGGEVEEPRTTLCISSQVGCALDCKFCFTGLLGARRNLTTGEIVGQVLTIARDQGLWGGLVPAATTPSPGPARRDHPLSQGREGHDIIRNRRLGLRPSRTATRLNVVFMGQGEPFLNFTAVTKAVRILADPSACGVPLRRITLSTAGIAPRIYDLARETVRPKLAISLNASNEEQRNALMPINRKYPLRVLLEACRAYPLRPRERITFEYVMLDGVNDSETDAARVVALLRGIRARVNLIPYNGGEGLPYRPTPAGRVGRFQQVLRAHGVPAFIRISRGQDIMAACGQLSLAESREAS